MNPPRRRVLGIVVVTVVCISTTLSPAAVLAFAPPPPDGGRRCLPLPNLDCEAVGTTSSFPLPPPPALSLSPLPNHHQYPLDSSAAAAATATTNSFSSYESRLAAEYYGGSRSSSVLHAASSSATTGADDPTKETAVNDNNNRRPLRTFNLNKKGSPFGFDKNAEVWNGRVAQVSFVWVVLQEYVQGKGMLSGLMDESSDPAARMALNLFCALVLTLSARFLVEPNAEAPPFRLPAGRRLRKSLRSLRPSTSHPDAFRQAKSMSKLFDPQRILVYDAPLNFNDNETTSNHSGPFGFKRNAEIWNSRMAMLSFAWVLVQETLGGSGGSSGGGAGVLEALDRRDPGAVASLGTGVALFAGLGAYLEAVQKSQYDFVDRVVGKEALRANVDASAGPKAVDAPYQSIDMTGITPDMAVSDPILYDDYLREIERARTRQKAEKLAYESSFSDSLKSMTTDGRATTTSIPAPIEPWIDTARWEAAVEDPSITASPGWGEAHEPVHVSAGMKASIERPLTINPYVPAEEEPPELWGTAYEPIKVSASKGVTQISRTISGPERLGKPTKTSWSSMPTPHPAGKFTFAKTVVDYKVDGYRFKPEVQAAAGNESSPHPAGTFKFGSSISQRIKSSFTPPPPGNKPKPVKFPVQGFQFQDDTKSVIQSTDTTIAISAPPAPLPTSLATDSLIQSEEQPSSNVNVMASNLNDSGNAAVPMNVPYGPVATSDSVYENTNGFASPQSSPYQQPISGSYLEALNQAINEQMEDMVEATAATASAASLPPNRGRTGSYLESLNAGNAGNAWIQQP